MATLTQQGSIDVFIPKGHHRFILGKGAETLKKIEAETGAKIQVPKINPDADAADEPINVMGSKEAMQAAKIRIEKISSEQMSRHREVFEAPLWTHPFIRGGNDKNLIALKAKHGIVAVDVPPASAKKTEIVVRGPQVGAMAAAKELKDLIKRKEKDCKPVTITVDKKQHKFVIGHKGSNINWVLEHTGVIVDVPAQDEPDNNTITLRGEQKDMGLAITKVYEFASSHQDAFIPCAEWMHRLLIGPKGSIIQEITENFGYDKVHVNFSKDAAKCGIELEGTPCELEAVQKELERRISEISGTTSHAEIVVPREFHPHLIGKGGSNLSGLKEKYAVNIKIPQEADKSQTIWIEGPPDGVKKAAAELSELAKKLGDEVNDTITLGRRFHRNLIGRGGENIKELRKQFPNIQINVPDGNSKSDIISIRGPSKEMVDAKKELQKMATKLEEEGYRIDVPILKQYHRNIIGKAGAKIQEIRKETNCQIELPKEGDDSEIISIIGRKENAEKARKMIRNIEKELVQIEEETVVIETKLHQALIGAGGKGVKELQGTDCIIHFPSDGTDKVTIRGKEEAVALAKKALLKEAAALRLQSFSGTIQCAPEFHRFLIGKGGSNMKDVRAQTGCRIAVPGANDAKQDIITILGTKEGVEKAQTILKAKVAELASIEEQTVTVPEKFHSRFTIRRAELINKISEECGKVQISFPRKKEGEEATTAGDVVTVKGPGNCVAAAVAMITERVNYFESEVTVEVEIEKIHHGSIIGTGGKQVLEIQNEFNVQITFPGRKDPVENNTIIISGLNTQVEGAKNAIIALVPVTVKYPLDAVYHQFLIGKGGSGLKEITDEFSIKINVPKRTEEGAEPENEITLTGKQELIDAVIVKLDVKKQGWLDEEADREKRSYSETIEVHPMFHSKIIGNKGETINRLGTEHKARVTMPGERNKDLGEDEIRITGYPECVEAMKAAIMKIVSGLESHIVQDVLISQKVHPRIIGSRGSGIRKIMNEFDVNIKIGRSPAQPDKVSVIGPADKVEECIDHLLNLEEEMLQELADRDDDEVYKPKKVSHFDEKKNKKANGQGYVAPSNAPWDGGDFPTLGNQNDSAPTASNWRPK